MCGIIGIIDNKDVVQEILDSLKLLEYRGYDSAGIAAITSSESITKKLEVRKAVGEISNLTSLLVDNPISGNIAIGHTRWATHGAQTIKNAHPVLTNGIAVVHNGIIENYLDIKRNLINEGYSFVTETDTEVIPKLIDYHINGGSTEIESVKKVAKTLHGRFSIVIIFEKQNIIIGIKNKTPLFFGIKNKAYYISSDFNVLSRLADEIITLEDSDMVVAGFGSYSITTIEGEKRHYKKHKAETIIDASKGMYETFMLKEIYEQEHILSHLLEHYKANNIDISNYNSFTIIACGSSFYAASIGKHWLEAKLHKRTSVEIASEFRTKHFIPEKDCLYICISQSGETADTIAALEIIQHHKLATLGIINNELSYIAKNVEQNLFTKSGTEIAVASTKTFTSQLLALAMLASANIDISPKKFGLDIVKKVLALDMQFKNLALQLYKAKYVLYIGRGTSYHIAQEGALKLKEITYIPSEGIASGELKHGPIALLEEDVPVIVIAPFNEFFDKTVSNICELLGRGALALVLTDERGKQKLNGISVSQILIMPETDIFSGPILYSIAVQFIAYHTAALKGINIDKPRNLAKSVTVE